jgi:uncharacterized membrane protein YecN with MAPEG domain
VIPTPTVPVRGVISPTPDDRSATRRFAAALQRTGQSPAAASDAVWVPAVSATLLLAAGAMTLATGKPWLFAALGPTALLIAASPGHATTRFHSVVVGHISAFVCAWLVLVLLGVDGALPSLGRSLPVVRVWASALAVAAVALVQPSLRAYHPPAAATALLVTMGAYRATAATAFSMLAGVVVVALLGEWFQRLRLRGLAVRAESVR